MPNDFTVKMRKKKPTFGNDENGGRNTFGYVVGNILKCGKNMVLGGSVFEYREVMTQKKVMWLQTL